MIGQRKEKDAWRMLYVSGICVALLLTFIGAWIQLKFALAKETEPFETYWNDMHSCRIDAYAPRCS